MCNVRVKFVLLISIFLLSETQCKSLKRNQKEAAVPTRNHLPVEETSEVSTKDKSSRAVTPSAILAIEIVDPNKNSTSTKSRNSKRTVGTQLGYGFQPSNYYEVSSKPKLVFYKYSQVGIPPYMGNDYYNNRNQVNIQKSIEYDLGNQQTQYVQQPPSNQQYQPGTTLYTTYNQGHVNQLSSQVPQQTDQTNLPVIYLKIYSNQLSSPALYSNLPENHPYSSLNNINLQSLLSGYPQTVQQSYSNQHESVNQVSGQNQDYQQVYVPQNSDQSQDYYLNQPIGYHQNYQDQISQYQYQQYQQPQQIEQVYHHEDSADDLPTHENYPDDAHTRVIFHSDNGGHFPEKPQSHKISVVPTVTSYTSHKARIPPAKSYSSIEFRPSQPDYTLSQQQDENGYYYYKPASTNYYTRNSVQPYQYTTPIPNNLPEVDSAPDAAPYNYHAHPTNTVKRNVRRPAVLPKRITKIKQRD